MRRRYLFSYDIADDDRRREVCRILKGQGDHAQYSVFICELDRRELVELRTVLDAILHHREDQLMILDLGPAVRSLHDCLEVLGRPYGPPGRSFVI